MTKKSRRSNWSANTIEILEKKIKKREHKRMLTEIAELFYDLACQIQHNQKKNSSKFSNTNLCNNEDVV